MAKTTKADLVRIAESIYLTARDNAFETVLENTSAAERAAMKAEHSQFGTNGLDMHPQFETWVRSTAQGEWDGGLTTDRLQYATWQNHGAERPLTAKQAEQVRLILLKQYNVEV